MDVNFLVALNVITNIITIICGTIVIHDWLRRK